MTPNLEENCINRSATSLGPTLFLQPINNTTQTTTNIENAHFLRTSLLSETHSDFGHQQHEDDVDHDVVAISGRNYISLQDNLRDLLIKVTSTEELDRVTQVKLRVIAHDVTLQHLSIYTPALRELILDGSVVSTLRDLGCGLKNLKILKINRCGLTCLDGMFSLESLEELYAADNSIQYITPCAFLPHIRVIDLKRNSLKDIETLTFLSICEKLEHVHISENDEISQFPKYREYVKCVLPKLKTLDGVGFENEGEFISKQNFDSIKIELIKYSQKISNKTNHRVDSPRPLSFSPLLINGVSSPRNRVAMSKNIASSFTINFPPKICRDRPSSATLQNRKADDDIKTERDDVHSFMNMQNAEAFPSIFHAAAKEVETNDDENNGNGCE